MALEIIKRGKETIKETINRVETDTPQIAYNSEGRITIRIPQYEGDVLVVCDRPLSKALIHFIKNGIVELPSAQAWCSECAKELDSRLPF